jgi:hypothetical protein
MKETTRNKESLDEQKHKLVEKLETSKKNELMKLEEKIIKRNTVI